MFTTDFSKAPKLAQGSHAFFGATRYAGLGAVVRLPLVWRRVSRRMRRSPGYQGHVIWYRFPFTFGNLSLWDTRENMAGFAHSAEHRAAIHWVTRPGVGEGAFIRFLTADATGHSLGSWRAEHDVDEWRDWARDLAGPIPARAEGGGR